MEKQGKKDLRYAPKGKKKAKNKKMEEMKETNKKELKENEKFYPKSDKEGSIE